MEYANKNEKLPQICDKSDQIGDETGMRCRNNGQSEYDARGENMANRDDGGFLSRGCRKMMQNRLKCKKMGKKRKNIARALAYMKYFL